MKLITENGKFTEDQQFLLELERWMANVEARIYSYCTNCHTYGCPFPFDRRCGNCNLTMLIRVYSEIDIAKIFNKPQLPASPESGEVEE